MSFYFDEEPSSQQQKNDEDFVCVNCGGDDYYVDPIGGALCCTLCFTQSQQMTQESTELDVEEVQALAARTSTGRVLVNRRAKSKGGTTHQQQERKPLEEFDTSKPLPNLVTCLHGIQQVMKYCIEPLCDLVGLSNETQVVQETVQTLWMSYLRAWTDGAEFYGKLHPEIRFSLRDVFLPSPYKAKVLKHLSYKAAQVVRAELNANDDEEKKDEAMDGKPPAIETSDNNNASNHSSLLKGHQESIRYFESSYHNPKRLMWMYYYKGKRGRLECALLALPSMNFVASLLWLAVSRAGVTLNHVLQWIANGALPLENAFKHCLAQDEQQALTHVASFFRMSKLPTLEEVQNLTNKLVVACGVKSFAHLHGMPESDEPASEEHKQPDAVESKGGEEESTVDSPVHVSTRQEGNPDVVESKEGEKEAIAASSKDKPATVASNDGEQQAVTEIRKRTDFSYVTPRSVPLLTARLINDLGFGQDVLDRSLALMGILKKAPSNLWLPAPLKGALPKNVGTTAQVLAVISVAFRMTPGWEHWVYSGPSAPSSCKMDSDDDTAMRHWEQERAKKKRRIESKSTRFVPLNEDNFRLLRNGPLVEGYLDYLEDSILDEKEAIFPKFRSSLESQSARDDDNMKPASMDNGNVVRKQSVLKESQSPFGMWRRQKMHDWKLGIKRKRAQWADANGLGEYVIYDDPLTHAQDRIRSGFKTIPIPEPFHPQYGLLLEYMSFTTNVKPSKIHAAITVLDEEILALVRPKEEPKRKRRGKKPVEKTSPEASMEVDADDAKNLGEIVIEASELAGENNEGDGHDDANAGLVSSSATDMVEV